jgi:hypothetical protein
MNRFVRAATAAALVSGGAVGCVHTDRSGETSKYANCVDTCWPERYNFAARQAVIGPFAQQAANGHFANQTLWNWHFEPGTDTLNSAGMEKLDSLARSTPAPDSRIYLQAARDIGVTPENMDKVAAMRDELTAKRAAAVMRYMATQPGNPVAYSIQVHDAPVPGIHSNFASTAWRGQLLGYVGGLQGGGGVAAVGGGGGVGLGAGAAPAPAPAGGGGGPAGPGY